MTSRAFYRQKPPLHRAGHLAKALLLLLVASTIGCDQVSKRLATVHLSGATPHSFLGDTVRLEYAENAGGFMSLGADLPPWLRVGFFTVGTGVLLVFCIVVFHRGEWTGLALMGLALVSGGGVSNLVDRIRQGAVVDFLNVGIGPLRTGIFNVADMAILLGLTLLLLRGCWTKASRTS